MKTVKNILDIESLVNDYKVVIFDLDDTLYLEKDYVFSGFKAISSYLDDTSIYDELCREFLYKSKNPIDIVLNKHHLLEQKDSCLEVYRKHVPNIRASDGVLLMLERIKKSKYLGIITDGRVDGQNKKIDSLGIRFLFDKIIITDELGGTSFRKPNKKAFELMKQYFDCQYEDMVYIGDNLSKDQIAPLQLGMGFIYFNNIEGLYNNQR